MPRKQRKKLGKKKGAKESVRKSIPAPSSSNRFKFNITHIIYLIVAVLVVFSLFKGSAGDDDDSGCGDCDGCGCGGCCGDTEDDDGDGADYRQYETVASSAPAELPTPSSITQCSRNCYVSGTTGDRFSYSYVIRLCDTGKAHVYLAGSDGFVVQTLRDETLIDKTISDSGTADKSSASQICVKIENGNPICTSNGREDC